MEELFFLSLCLLRAQSGIKQHWRHKFGTEVEFHLCFLLCQSKINLYDHCMRSLPWQFACVEGVSLWWGMASQLQLPLWGGALSLHSLSRVCPRFFWPNQTPFSHWLCFLPQISVTKTLWRFFNSSNGNGKEYAILERDTEFIESQIAKKHTKFWFEESHN